MFAGTVDDSFFIDLGAAFDTLNFRAIPGPGSTGVPLVLSDAQDATDDANFLADDVSGYNVNCIAIEVPIRRLTATGSAPTAQDPLRQIGLWGTTSRRAFELRTRRDAGPSTPGASCRCSGWRTRCSTSC